MKNLKFSNKLLLTLVPIVILSIGTITWLSFGMSQETILEQQVSNMRQLVGKTIQSLEVWMQDRIKDSKMYSKTGVFIDACQGRRVEECKARLVTYHKFAPFYENIFVALPSGETILDSLGGKSVGTNISTLIEYAPNVEKALKGETWISQPAASPITGRPVCLITSPIYSDNKLVGIMGTAVEVNAFSDEFIGDIKIGQNGYLFLADNTGLLIAHPNKDLVMKVRIRDYDFGRQMASQKSGQVEYNWEGRNFISFFDTYNQKDWLVIASADRDEFLGTVRTIRNYSLLLGVSAVLLLGLAVWFLARGMSNSLAKTLDKLNEIARGDLSRDVEVTYLNRADEIGLLAQGLQKVIISQRDRVAMAEAIARGRLNIEVVQASEKDILGKALKEMVSSLSDIIQNTNQAIERIASGAQQVSDSSHSLSSGATEQAASLEQITSSMTELGSQTLTNAENAGQANSLALTARESAETGNKQMGEMIEAMGGINQASKEIAKIIKTIDDIAFQTNLLALNAAVEAARAGKHGKGFAVVAQEVRNLAGRSGKAAQETAELIEGTVKKVEKGAEILERTGHSLSEIVTGITKVTDLVGEIAVASNEQAEGIKQVNQGLSQIEKVTQQNTATSEQSASAAEELSSQAIQLRKLMLRFDLAQGKKDPGGKTIRKTASNRPPKPKTIGYDAGASPVNKTGSTEKVVRPEDVISLDDKDFGKY